MLRMVLVGMFAVGMTVPHGSAGSPAQSAPVTTHPNLAGVWIPADPVTSDKRFMFGLTPIPGRGQLTIEQRPDRLTLTITMPDADLDRLLDINGRFYTTITYRVSPTPGRAGGYGAAGPPPPPNGPTWFGDELVTRNPRPASNANQTTTRYSLDGARLKSVTQIHLPTGPTNTVTEWFVRAEAK